MNQKDKKSYYLLFIVGIILLTVFGIWWFNPKHIPQNFSGIWHTFDIIIFVVLSYVVWQEIFMEFFSWLIVEKIDDKRNVAIPIAPPGLRVAYITAFVPGVESYETLKKTLKAMRDVDYPHDVWLLDEGDDDEAKALCQKYSAHHFSRKGSLIFNTDSGKYTKKTKGGNYNSWLHGHQNDYNIVAQHDVDFIPRKNFLTRTLGYFNDSSVGFVGCPQVYGNQNASWIAHGAAEQTYGFYGPLQRGFAGHEMTLLIGANHIMRVKAYLDIDGYTAHITEDMLTGMKLYTKDWKSIYVPEILLVGEGPITWVSYFNQQMRWAYGCMDILFRHAPKLLPQMITRRQFNYISLMQFYFGGLAQFLGIILLTLYFVFGITAAQMPLWPILYLYLPVLVFQSIFQIWLNRFNVAPKKEKGLMLRGKLLALSAWPIYLVAFIGVVRKKRLTYVVTPKGENQIAERAPALFLLHFILGTVTLVGIVVGIFLGNVGGQMIFWASINTAFMYFFFFSEMLPYLSKKIKEQAPKFYFSQNSKDYQVKD